MAQAKGVEVSNAQRSIRNQIRRRVCQMGARVLARAYRHQNQTCAVLRWRCGTTRSLLVRAKNASFDSQLQLRAQAEETRRRAVEGMHMAEMRKQRKQQLMLTKEMCSYSTAHAVGARGVARIVLRWRFPFLVMHFRKWALWCSA